MKASITITILLIIAAGCSTPEPAPKEEAAPKQEQKATVDSTGWDSPTESFRGRLNGNDIMFSHKNYKSYRYAAEGEVTLGLLNTERGYGDDKDATVYVLDHDKPASEQKYFVRLTDGAVHMLDAQRTIISSGKFVRSHSDKDK
jgi:hypothetical protein